MTDELPPDLLRLGWKLIVRAPDRMFAVSQSWGCTGTKENIGEVIREAQSLIGYIRWREQEEQRLRDAYSKTD